MPCKIRKKQRNGQPLNVKNDLSRRKTTFFSTANYKTTYFFSLPADLGFYTWWPTARLPASTYSVIMNNNAAILRRYFSSQFYFSLSLSPICIRRPNAHFSLRLS